MNEIKKRKFSAVGLTLRDMNRHYYLKKNGSMISPNSKNASTYIYSVSEIMLATDIKLGDDLLGLQTFIYEDM